MTPSDFTIKLKHIEVPAHRAGTGSTLLYLHDELSSAWSPFLAQLSDQFDVVAPELPGFGSTARPDWVESVDDMAFLVADIADELADPSGLVVVGSGLGGWLAIEAAVRGAPFSVLSVLGAPGVDITGDPPVDYFVLMPEERGALFFDEPGRAPVVEEDTDIRNQMMTARLVWQPRYVSPNLLHRLHRVTAPTLVVWGQNDRFLSLAHGEALARGVGNGHLEIVVDSGHFPAIEQPDITARLIIDFARG